MANASIIIFNSDGSVFDEVLITEDAERVEELMTADYAQLSWRSDGKVILPAGLWIEFEGERLTLLDPYEPEQKSEVEYLYTPQFQSSVMAWQKVPFFHYTYSVNNSISGREPDWTLTDTPANFMRTVCDAIYNETGESWSYAVAADLDSSATITFNATDVLSALNSICGAFDTEWRADKDANTLYLGKAERTDGTYSLMVGGNVGVPSVTLSKEKYFNRFYIYGSTRNITQDYQGSNVNNLVNKRLTLNPAEYPGGYIDIARDPGVPVYPKILIFDEVYPHSGLKVANLRPRLMYRLDESKNKIQIGTDSEGSPIYDMYSIWYFQLPGFKLNDTTYSKDNPNGMLISGKVLSVHFNSGALRGREFELIYHPKAETLRNSDGLDFNVMAGDYEIKFIEESGLIIPMQTGIVPSDGDDVILFNLRMPEEYISTAYEDLRDAALKEISEKYESDLNNYTVKSNPIEFDYNDPQLEIGSPVQYINGDYQYHTRVIKIVRKMDFTCEQEITIGNAKIKGNTATLKEEVVNANANINILAQLNQLTQNVTKYYQRAQQILLDNLAGSSVDSMFELVTQEDGSRYIRAKLDFVGVGRVVGCNRSGSGGSIGGGSVGASDRLADLLDVELSPLSNGQMLVYRNGRWVNESVAYGGGGIDEAQLASYLSRYGYVTSSVLGNYVTLDTAQEIAGLKTFTDVVNVSNDGIAIGGNIILRNNGAPNNNTVLSSTGGDLFLRPCGTFDSTGEVRIKPNGTITAGGLTTNTLNVSSNVLVSNLNADMLDGLHSNQFMRESVVGKVAMNANDLFAAWTIYRPDHDLNTNTAAWTNFPVSKPPGGFSLINLQSGNYKHQLYLDYNFNNIFIRRQYYNNGVLWSGWTRLVNEQDNIASASKLQTARNIYITSYNNYKAGDAISFDGSGDVILKLPNTICALEWFRSYGNTGWYNQTFGGGIYMSDTTYVRTYGGKSFYCDQIIQSGSQMLVGTSLVILQTGGYGHGISLFANGDNVQSYGILFGKTANFGKHGAVQGDWATYFTMDGSTDRGWCFRHKTGGIVASISANGNILASGKIAGTNTSDIRLKENVFPVKHAAEILRGLGGFFTFDYKPGVADDDRAGHIGLIWQNVQGHFANLMSLRRPDGYGALNYLCVDYINLIGAATLENSNEIEVLKNRIEKLERRCGCNVD